MRVIPITDDAELLEATSAMLDAAMCHPKQREIIFELINDLQVNRADLFGTGFAFGVAFAMNEFESGRIKKIAKG